MAGATPVVYSTSADFQMNAKNVFTVWSFPLQACNVFRLYNGKAAEAELKALADRGRNLQVWCFTPRYHTTLNPSIHPNLDLASPPSRWQHNKRGGVEVLLQ